MILMILMTETTPIESIDALPTTFLNLCLSDCVLQLVPEQLWKAEQLATSHLLETY